MNRIFPVAFVASLTIHSMLLLHWGSGMSTRQSTEAPQPLVVAADTVTAQPLEPAPLPLSTVMRRAERPAGGPALPPTGVEGRVNIVERAQRPPLQAVIPAHVLPQTRPGKPAVPAVIDLSNLAIELGEDPVYLQYFQTIRERIRYYAQRHVSRLSQRGEVFVRFVISAAGQMQSVEVDAARSSRDAALQRMSCDSVRQSGPFPPFPSTFNQPQITFHIIIQYEAN